MPARADLRDTANQIVRDLVSDPKIARLRDAKLLVAQFRSINAPQGDGLPKIVQEMLTTAFIQDKHFRVVEREQLDEAVKELKISSIGLAENDGAQKLGKFLDADYMVVGSISSLHGKTSIDARIVLIETGESLSAAAATVDSAYGSGSFEEPIRHSAGPAGTVTNSYAVTGGAKFRVAWRESLGGDPVWSFACGDTTGDGFPRVVLVRGVEPPSDAGPILGECRFEVAQWSGEQFKPVWTGNRVTGDPHCTRVNVASGRTSGPAPILVSTIWHDWSTQVWQWNGTTYECPAGWSTQRCIFSGSCGGDPGMVTGFYDRQPFVARFAASSSWEQSRKVIPAVSYTEFGCRMDCAAADFDGDGEMEVALIKLPKLNGSRPEEGKPIRIYAVSGARKAATQGLYDGCLAAWRPDGEGLPYLVATRKGRDENGGAAGASVCLIQWNGEDYQEVWNSDPIDDQVLEMKVCDPKGEGQEGLVVLSRDSQGSYLTKIVAE